MFSYAVHSLNLLAEIERNPRVSKQELEELAEKSGLDPKKLMKYVNIYEQMGLCKSVEEKTGFLGLRKVIKYFPTGETKSYLEKNKT